MILGRLRVIDLGAVLKLGLFVHDLIVVFPDHPRVLFAKSEGTEKHSRNRYYRILTKVLRQNPRKILRI